MNSDAITSQLRASFGSLLSAEVRRPGLFQVTLPMVHDDGDAPQIFVRGVRGSRDVRVSDLGHTLMRCSYSQPLTPKMFDALSNLAERHGFRVDEGELVATVTMEELLPAVFGLVQIETEAEATITAPVARKERSEQFKKVVQGAIRSVFADCALDVFDKATDPEGLFLMDAAIAGEGHRLGVAIVANDDDAERAVSSKLYLAPLWGEAHPRWVAIPRDINVLGSRSRSRLMSQYYVPAPVFEEGLTYLPEKLADLANRPTPTGKMMVRPPSAAKSA